MARYDTEQIKQFVTVPDLLARHGIEVNRAGFCSCPFHAEKTGSMKVWNDHVYCFGCHRKADVIDLAQELYGLPFKGAVDALCAEYGLQCTDTASYDQARQKAAERAREREREQAEENRLLDRYFDLVRLWSDLQWFIRNCAPVSPEAHQNPMFEYAIANISRVEYELDCADAACIAFNERRKQNH